MKGKKTFFIAVLLIAGGLLSLGYTLYHSVIADTGPGSQEVSSSTLAAAAGQAPPANFPEMNHPAELSIPSLGIDAKVVDVGVTAKGAMAVPKSFQQVGWYKYGAMPGNSGSAVLAGHVDNGLSLAGVFKKLKNIGVGDAISVTDDAGDVATFEVTGTSSLDYKSSDTSAIFKKGGPAVLTLITCDGDWVQSDKTYDARLIVTATRVK
ncbi:MAG TPA: class F sortase [Candidatus Paceibacterota bacterium]|nr:class F sortase [Candidatus Paceibacterota bacterium]